MTDKPADTLRDELEASMTRILAENEPTKTRVDALKIVAEYVAKTRIGGGTSGDKPGSGFDE